MNEIRTFTDPSTNITLAHAAAPEGSICGGQLSQKAQSDLVPFTFSTHAVSGTKGILMLGFSEELYYDHSNTLAKEMMKNIPGANLAQLRSYTDPEDYFLQLAASVIQSPIELIAETDLPSLSSRNMEASAQRLASLVSLFAWGESQGGMECVPGKTVLRNLLYRFKGISPKDGKPCTILCGGDFEGFEVTYPASSMFTMLGGMFRAGNQNTSLQGNEFGHEPCDLCIWGSADRFLLITPDDCLEEALKDFGQYVSTWQADASLLKRMDDIRQEKIQTAILQNQMFNAQTMQNIANNQFQQAKLTNMLRDNAASISQGIMDSWNKKMASDSRSFANYSEAIRGVNTYVGTDGRPVEVSVSADHVYQNPSGTTYGVSGNAVDEDILSRLSWTEIHRR